MSLRNQNSYGIQAQKRWVRPIKFCLVFPHVFTSSFVESRIEDSQTSKIKFYYDIIVGQGCLANSNVCNKPTWRGWVLSTNYTNYYFEDKHHQEYGAKRGSREVPQKENPQDSTRHGLRKRPQPWRAWHNRWTRYQWLWRLRQKPRRPCLARHWSSCRELEGHIVIIGSGNKGKDGDMLRTSKEKMATYIGTKYGDNAAQE